MPPRCAGVIRCRRRDDGAQLKAQSRRFSCGPDAEGNACASTVLYIDDLLELPPRSSEVLEKVGFALVHVRDPREAADRLRR